jgi:NAD/NADP transhydrogenase beta subunit
MSLQTYHLLHLLGLILVFVGFGGLLSSEGAKKAMKWHGIGLVISLVSGFGMAAKYSKLLPPEAPSYYTQPWVIAKFALWLVLGFLPVLAKRRIVSPQIVVLIAIFVGTTLAYLGYFKPTF